MAITNQQKNIHLAWRAGFGPAAADLDRLSKLSPKSFLDSLISKSSSKPAYIDVANAELRTLVMGTEGMDYQRRDLTEEQRRFIRDQYRQGLKTLNLGWLDQMVVSEQQMREKLSLFWHGHFSTRVVNIFHQQQLLDIIRQHALGNFGTLLREVSKSASMINFLNNNQNRKGRPNENFAREVMELFTLGRGNYTEKDIKEAARAFTGWGADPKGEFVFRKNQHDDGSKEFLGKTGNFQGEDILTVLLEQKQTARFITQKVYRYFVNEDAPAARIDQLSARFFQSNYDILSLLKDIFSSEWFFDEKNIGTQIKSPVELIAGIRRFLPMQIQNEEVQLVLERLLGQVLFYPPNVAGWPGGRNWIDSSTLMMRLRIPQLVYEGEIFQLKPKDDDDQMMGMMDRNSAAPNRPAKPGRRPGQKIDAVINWDPLTKQLEKIPREKLIAQLSELILLKNQSINADLLLSNADQSARESYIKTVTIQLMSTPEYQLC